MTQIATVILTDDLDEKVTSHKPTSTNVVTIPFALDGETYEIDLGPKNADALRQLFAPYIDAARRHVVKQPTGSRNGSRENGRRRPKGSTVEIREWVRANGWPGTKDRGRIPADAEAAYAAAH